MSTLFSLFHPFPQYPLLLISPLIHLSSQYFLPFSPFSSPCIPFLFYLLLPIYPSLLSPSPNIYFPHCLLPPLYPYPTIPFPLYLLPPISTSPIVSFPHYTLTPLSPFPSISFPHYLLPPLYPSPIFPSPTIYFPHYILSSTISIPLNPLPNYLLLPQFSSQLFPSPIIPFPTISIPLNPIPNYLLPPISFSPIYLLLPLSPSPTISFPSPLYLFPPTISFPCCLFFFPTSLSPTVSFPLYLLPSLYFFLLHVLPPLFPSLTISFLHYSLPPPTPLPHFSRPPSPLRIVYSVFPILNLPPLSPSLFPLPRQVCLTCFPCLSRRFIDDSHS